jgi:arylsulfatase A-like enzyme
MKVAIGVWLIPCALLVSCSRTPSRPPDVYVLLVDTLRADHLSAYGYSRPTSPALNDFARSALVFTSVTAVSSWTLPSVGSLFTARYPTVHGLRAHGNGAPETVRSLRPGLTTLAEGFQRAGYYTAAVIANVWLQQRNGTGIDRGFMRYEVTNRMRADEVNHLAETILEEKPDRPVFLYLHYMEPHAPYDAPALPPTVLGGVQDGNRRLPDNQVAPARHMVKKEHWADDEGRTLGEIIDAYDRTVYTWDQAFGRFIDWLHDHGRLDSSWISVVADHGEEIFEHGGWGHGTWIYDEQTKIPWVLRGPGQSPGRSAAPVSLVDVAPTMLAAAGVRVPPTMHGLDARRAPAQRLRFAEVDSCRGNWRACFQRAVWDPPYKLILLQERTLLFNLQDDPHEQSALPPDPRLAKLLTNWVREREEAGKQFGNSQREALDPAVRERLRALGY